jgi:hypothetical protein
MWLQLRMVKAMIGMVVVLSVGEGKMLARNLPTLKFRNRLGRAPDRLRLFRITGCLARGL